MQVCTSLQTDNHADTTPLSFLQAGCFSCRPTNSVKALKASTWIRFYWTAFLQRYLILAMLRNKHIYYKLTIGQSLGMDTYTNKLQTVTGRPQYGWQRHKTHDRSVIIHIILGLPAPTAKKNFVGGNFTANMPSLIAKMVHGKFRCYYSQCDQHYLHNHATAMCTNIIALAWHCDTVGSQEDTHTHTTI